MEATTMLRSKWFLPGFSAALGLAFLAALWAGGKPRDGLFSLGVMTVLGLLILLGGRSETIRGLRGDGRDERVARLDLVATAIAGNVLIGRDRRLRLGVGARPRRHALRPVGRGRGRRLHPGPGLPEVAELTGVQLRRLATVAAVSALVAVGVAAAAPPAY